MHVRFRATVIHGVSFSNKDREGAENPQQQKNKQRSTEFLALDKCLSRRQFLEFLDIECSSKAKMPPYKLCYDAEWLSILRATQPYLVSPPETIPPLQLLREQVNRHATAVHQAFKDSDFVIPTQLFVKTVREYNISKRNEGVLHLDKAPLELVGNPQTDFLCDKLGMTHTPPVTYPFSFSQHVKIKDVVRQEEATEKTVIDKNEIDID
jgi:hypothetical protein